jgi:hypothetical protein
VSQEPRFGGAAPGNNSTKFHLQYINAAGSAGPDPGDRTSLLAAALLSVQRSDVSIILVRQIYLINQSPLSVTPLRLSALKKYPETFAMHFSW